MNYERRTSGRQVSAGSQEKEIRIYKAGSIYMILLTVILGGMVILTVHSQGGSHYPGVTIYVAAIYTFIKVPLAARNWIKTTKMETPLLITIRSIGYADACVSVLSLQTAMFSSFSNMGVKDSRILMNGITGVVVCLMVLGMGIYGVHKARKMEIYNRKESKDG